VAAKKSRPGVNAVVAAAAALEARNDLGGPDEWPVAQPLVIISAVIPGKP
jgi:hypothetical protein